MAGKKINQLDPLTDDQANDDARYLPLADPITGIAGKITIAQAKSVFGANKLTYTGGASETTTVTISALAGMEILFMVREGSPLYEIDPGPPGSTEFVWDLADITLFSALGLGERLLILYRNN